MNLGSATKTALAAAILSAVLFWGAPAKANDIDLSTWTCKQFQSAAKDEVTLILAWLDGYYRGDDDPPVISTDQWPPTPKSSAAIAPHTRIPS